MTNGYTKQIAYLKVFVYISCDWVIFNTCYVAIGCLQGFVLNVTEGVMALNKFKWKCAARKMFLAHLPTSAVFAPV